MYHPTRGGVRGGRDQFKWDDVKVDKHRENYLGHSIMAPVGRWQKGKDLHWYARDKKSAQDEEAAKEEIRRIKEQEEQAMREALGLAPKSSSRSHGNRLDKHEFQELVKKGSTAEDLGEGHADAVQVHGLGFARAPRAWEDPSTLPSNTKELVQILPEKVDPVPPVSTMTSEAKSNDEINSDKRNREEKRTGKDHKSRHSRDSDDRKKHKKDKEKRRHESDYARDDRKKHKKDRDSRRRHDSD